jgi:hypothetical protein
LEWHDEVVHVEHPRDVRLRIAHGDEHANLHRKLPVFPGVRDERAVQLTDARR